MNHIKVLPIHVANKIAAGEVVDRPSSVLKELIENAVDAGSTQMDVEISAGGRKLVSVSDNGSGMNRDDALLSVERQATSKITDVDDIERIDTLGFRGEALAAIAAVSRFRLTTCSTGEVTGTEILITGGRMQDVRDFGCPPGTCIEVRDLFFNIPARRKFLRSQHTEVTHVRSGFIVQALSHAPIGMSLRIDGRETYRLAGGAALEDRLAELFGADLMSNLKRTDFHGAEVSVTGYVSTPRVSRSDRNELYVYVNGRATSAPLIAYAIKEGYHRLLPSGRYPSVFLFLTMDPSLVDVNVHPTKREVRFRHPIEVRDAVINAIRESLQGDVLAGGGRPEDHHAEPGGRESGDAAAPETRSAADVELKIDDLPTSRAFKYPRLPAATDADARGARQPAAGVSASTAGQVGAGDAAAIAGGEGARCAGPDESAPWSWCRVVGQLGNLYVVLETEDGFVMMDPHSAHERVLFERFMSDVVNRKVEAQALLIPETVELKPADAMRVRDNVDLFRDMGFGVSEFGGDAFVVDALPSYFADASAQTLLVEVSHSLQEAGARGGTERWREESIAQAACKSAVKSRDKLTLQEIERLVVDLARAEMPYTCPHGRPTLIFTSFKELNKKFGRE